MFMVSNHVFVTKSLGTVGEQIFLIQNLMILWNPHQNKFLPIFDFTIPVTGSYSNAHYEMYEVTKIPTAWNGERVASEVTTFIQLSG